MNITGAGYNTQGWYNPHTGEFHSMKKQSGSCHLDDAGELQKMTWGKARRMGADLCGHEYPGKSLVNDTKSSRISVLA